MEVPAVMMTDVDNDMEKVDFSGRNPTIDGTGIFSGSQFTTNIFFALFWAIFQCQCALRWAGQCHVYKEFFLLLIEFFKSSLLLFVVLQYPKELSLL